MEILLQLGANKTAFVQFFIFAITIGVLTIFVFNPFYAALDLRQQKTKGAENVAKETIEEAKNLNLVFQTQAREQNDKIKSIYDVQKKEASTTVEEIIQKSKKETDALIAQSRIEITEQIKKSSEQVKTLSQEIATQLTQKIESGL